MKAFIKRYEDIKKVSIMHYGYFHAKEDKAGPAFVTAMTYQCGSGPFEFKPLRNEKKGWYEGQGWNWHISWLKPITKNKQYLLRFE